MSNSEDDVTIEYRVGNYVEWGHSPSSYGTGKVEEVFQRVAGYQHLKISYRRKPSRAEGATTIVTGNMVRPLGTETYPDLPDGFLGWAADDYTLAAGLRGEHEEFCEMEELEVEDSVEQYFAVVLSKTRDSDLIETCNYDVLVSKLEEECDDEKGHTWWDLSFNHWAVGWVDYLLVRVDKGKALEVCADAAKSISDYPILDEDAYGELELEAAQETWENYERREFVQALEKELGDDEGDELSDDEIDVIRREMECHGDMTWEYRGNGDGICYLYDVGEWLAPTGVSTKRELYEQCKAAQGIK